MSYNSCAMLPLLLQQQHRRSAANNGERRRLVAHRAKTCDKCPGENPAAVPDKLTFNGSRYDIDLCEKDRLELLSAIMQWADIGTKTGETGIFDQQREARPVTVAVDRPAAPKVDEPEPAPAGASAKPLHTHPLAGERALRAHGRMWLGFDPPAEWTKPRA